MEFKLISIAAFIAFDEIVNVEEDFLLSAFGNEYLQY